MAEACRIIITEEASGLVNVSAPMQYKELCYNILADAKKVIDYTPPEVFFNPGRTLIIAMNMTGLVDVAAPLPPRDWCYITLTKARTIIEQFESSEEKMRPAGYADCLPGP